MNRSKRFTSSEYLLETVKGLLPLLSLALLALLSFWYLKAKTDQKPPPPTHPKTHIPDYVFSNVRLTSLNETGRAKYRLLADEFKHFEDDASIDITRPRLRLFSKDAEPMTVTSKTGHMDGDLSILELFDNVNISRPPQLDSAGIMIDPHLLAVSNYFKAFINDDIIKTNLPVKIERGQSIMTSSQGAEFDNVQQKIILLGNVQGFIAPADTAKKSKK